MLPKLLPLVAALTLAGAAHAISVNMTDFQFGPAASVDMTGSQGYDGQAGAFAGTLSDSPPVDIGRASLAAASSTSFVAWCAQLTQTFEFGKTYDYALVSGAGYFGAQRTNDLSRLFTAANTNHFVFDSNGSAAFQAGIWEIIYEHDAGYGFGSGTERGAPSDPGNAGIVSAFGVVDSFLTHLGQYNASYKIDVLTNDAQQDFLVATIPEPETWALLVGGLGAIGLVRRRRKA